MTNPGLHHHIEIRDGDETVAAADVTTPPEAEGTAQASLRAAPGHIAPGSRASLVDAVMDLPEVQESSRLEAALPLGDTETLGRLPGAQRQPDDPARRIKCAARRGHPAGRGAGHPAGGGTGPGP